MNTKSSILSYLTLTLAMKKVGILSAMEYRISFLLQVLGMVVNDIGLLFVWVIFFDKFKSINGWDLSHTMTLLAVTAFSYGLLDIFAQGAFRLSATITKGELDYYLTLPKNILWNTTFSRTSISGIGDLLFGLGLFFLTIGADPGKFIIFLLTGVVAAGIMFNFMIILHTLTFYFGNFDDSAQQLVHILNSFSTYPQNIFSGLLKLVTFTIVPAYFVFSIPVSLMLNFDSKLVLEMYTFWVASTLIMSFFFKRGLKHYESGNLIGGRT